MTRKFARRLATVVAVGLLAATALPAPARAADHLMEVNEVMTSVGGNPAAQFIEILDPVNEPFPSPPYRLVVHDANGTRLGHHDLGGDAQIIDSNVPMLISTPAADAALGVTGHQALGVALPTTAGQITFTRGTTEQKIHTLTYGCINTAVSGVTVFGPGPTDTQSAQLQTNNSVTLRAPTPKAMNTVGAGALACAEGYARPTSASPATFRLVPAFNACTSADSNHGAPLTLGSCNGAAQTSSYLTFNANERQPPFFGVANGSGTVVLKVTCHGSLNPPVENGDTPPCSANAADQEDVRITSNLAGVRCVGTAGQGNCAGGAGTNYNGKVLLRATLRITDRLNGATLNPATVTDTVLSVGFQCNAGSCSTTTSTDSIYPNVAQEQRRAVWELSQMQILDGGSDGELMVAPAPASGPCPPACVGNGGETVFLRQGFFAP